MPGRVHVFIASSVDGFIAGPADEIDWLSAGEGTEDTFTPFFAKVGALLMGRRTYEVARGFDGPWPYGDTPVLVATHRELTGALPTVRAVSGPIAELVAQARDVAGDRDVYVDGGQLVRAAVDTVTLIPMILGAGIPLFAGTTRRHPLELVGARPIGNGLVELRYRPA